MSNQSVATIPSFRIESRILFVRGQKVILDSDLAELYGVSTKVLNQAVKRNLERFPEDFMFRLNKEETKAVLRSRIVTLDGENHRFSGQTGSSLRSQSVTLKRGQHLKYAPYAFTEQGVGMLSGVLNSPRAIQVHLTIIRTFVKLRELLASHADLARKLEEMEKKYDKQFSVVFDAIRALMAEDEKPKREIGFHTLMPRPAKTDGAKAKRSKP